MNNNATNNNINNNINNNDGWGLSQQSTVNDGWGLSQQSTIPTDNNSKDIDEDGDSNMKPPGITPEKFWINAVDNDTNFTCAMVLYAANKSTQLIRYIYII